MKKVNILIVFMALCLYSIPTFAQTDKGEEIKVPLSNSGQAGTLHASSHKGSITVETHNGSDVIVTLIPDKDADENESSGMRKGLKKISAGSFNAEISEEDNNVYVLAGFQTEVDMRILVPSNFSVTIGTHQNGDVIISKVNGVVEVNAHHGDVELIDVGSSANVNTHHGEITATFVKVDGSKPMAFTTYHGDVDITLPANTSFNSKIKTTKGDIYTDFEMKVDAQAAKIEKDKSGKTKIEIGRWRHGKIGSGGAEYMMSSYHGDVIIRKK